MTRWQDRGEVEDSEDDEELSLDSETSFHERPQKRTKLYQETDDVQLQRDVPLQAHGEDPFAFPDENEDSNGWRRTTAARTYGRRGRLRGLERLPEGEKEANAKNLVVEDGIFAVTPEHDASALGSPLSKSPDGRNNLSVTLSPPLAERRETHPTETLGPREGQSQSAANPRGLRAQNLAVLQLGAAVLHKGPREQSPEAYSEPGQISSLGDAHFTEDNGNRPSRSRTPSRSDGDHENFPHINDLLSSPLSERDVSPPAEFRRLGLDKDDLNIHDSLSNDFRHNLTAADFSPKSAADARRSLRARKEIQLHPYMYDKAQYQKQFRERGLRPIRVIEQDAANEETQSVIQSDDSQDAATSSAVSTQDAEALPAAVARQAGVSLNFFDLPDSSSDSEPGMAHRRLKRRKLDFASHAKRSGFVEIKRLDQSRSESGDSSRPPSPPRTSSDMSTPKAQQSSSHGRPAMFRFPSGHTPAPLPTPHVSSDAKQTSSVRSSAAPHRPPLPASSPEASSSESDEDGLAEIEARRLRREQKRIKGVLPASWLRMDYRKQNRQESLSPVRRRQSTASPPKSQPRRGIARKIISGRSRSHGSRDLQNASLYVQDLDVSDEEVQGHSLGPPSSPATIHAGAESGGLFEDEDEDMENDFIEPMLAGSGQARRPRTKTKHRKQPLITHAFQRVSRDHATTSGEGLAHGRTRGSTTSDHPRQHIQRSRPSRVHAPVVQLSIIDAPLSPSDAQTNLPQFVRLALRRSRKRPGQGRHSPNHKFIRLATADDTKDATSVLQAWRSGSIAPRETSPGALLHDVPLGLASASGDGSGRLLHMMGNEPSFSDMPGRSGVSNLSVKHRPRLRRLRIDSSASIGGNGPDPGNVIRGARQRPLRPLNLHRLRGGQLETLESEFVSAHQSAAFSNRMQHLTESLALPEDRIPFPGFHLSRYLGASGNGSRAAIADRQAQHQEESATRITTDSDNTAFVIPHRPRKARAHRLNTDSREYRQPSEPLPNGSTLIENPPALQDVSGEVLEGLGAFGTRYAVDFDVRPLQGGTCFQHSTFIGSGEFEDAMNISSRDLSRDTGRVCVHLDGEIFEWGAWTEDVAAQFTRIASFVANALSTLRSLSPDEFGQQQVLVDCNVDYLLRSILRYCTKCVWFVDAVDRRMCVQSLDRLVADLTDAAEEHGGPQEPQSQTFARIAQYQLVLAKVATLLGDHAVVDVDTKRNAEQLLSRTAGRLARFAVIGKLGELRELYENLRRLSQQKTGVACEDWTLSSVVLLNHTARGARRPGTFLWDAILVAMNTDLDQTCAVKDFETIWSNVFTVLPALEIDTTGIARISTRFSSIQDGWSIAQKLVDRALQLYESSSKVRGYSVNEYVRAVLARCHKLISEWGWWRAEAVLNIIYDFFTRRELLLLKREELRGSPRFLDQLGTSDLSLDVQPDDNSFHIFLKTLAIALLGLHKHQVYSDRKIQGVLWRFIPNHDRKCRKDADVERSTLESLRNHHDLLCTLYFSSPPGHRPGVHLLRALVDHTTSHREACRLNVRAWAHIASYQASTTEAPEEMQPLTSWYAEIVAATMTQYRLAKTEAQSDYDRAKDEGARPSEALLETTVAINQRQIAATIVDALAGLKRAIASASSLPLVVSLAEGTIFWKVLDIFDPTQKRLLSAMSELLKVINAALDAEERFSVTRMSQSVTEDSQEFGDFGALQEYAATHEAAGEATMSIASVLLLPLGQFVSNVLGADVAPDDALLQEVVDVWVRLASITVKRMEKRWLDYLDEYSASGWRQMRDTAQKRKFTAYFVSRMVELSGSDAEIRQHVLSAWLQSLVEREALLKFQHVLTSSLLNHSKDDPLLRNLPFAKETTSGQYNISLVDLRQRRLALISAVLCNIRQDYEIVTYERPHELQEARRMYITVLQQVMQTMKSNYEELQTSGARVASDDSVQGAYVEFVQQVVSFLQQHTADICPVDRFFTDSGAFPLPADDPNYVVGKLRRYVPKLSEARTRKALAEFIHTVIQRAIIDQQQPYLVSQMATAVKGIIEHGDVERPSLRHVLLTAIFPAYIENALETPCSWIPVVLILRSCQRIIADLLYNIRIEDDQSVMAVVESTSAILRRVNQQWKDVFSMGAGRFDQPHIHNLLRACIELGASSLALILYIRRVTLRGAELMIQIRALFRMSSIFKALCDGVGDAVVSDFDAPTLAMQCAWQDTREYVDAQMKHSLNPNWQRRDAGYCVWKNGSWKDVVVDLQSSESERAELLGKTAEFRRAYQATFGARMRRRQQAEGGLHCMYA